MTKMWKAILKVQVPSGLKTWDHSTNSHSYQPTSPRVMEVIVPDSGGFYNTKMLLEGSYGHGTVMGLFEHH